MFAFEGRRIGHQQAIGLIFTAANPTPELMQLSQTEPLSSLHQHDRGVGHVNAHLYHRGGDQDVQFAPVELSHDSFFLLAFHAAMKQTQAQVGENFLL